MIVWYKYVIYYSNFYIVDVGIVPIQITLRYQRDFIKYNKRIIQIKYKFLLL